MACDDGPSVRPPPAPASPVRAAEGPAGEDPLRFVGGERCASCHAAEAEAWRGSHHDRALGVPAPDTVHGDFADAAFDGPGGPARFSRRGDAFRVAAPGRDGTPGEWQVAWLIGVSPLEQLLLPAPGGRLQAFGVAWDTRPAAEGGARWYALYPDDPPAPGDPLHWTGFEQTANHQCLECHTTAYQKGYDEAADAYATRWAEPDVSCESCHGPGSRHVAWAEARPPGDEGLVVSFAGPGEWRFAADAPIATRRGPVHEGPPEADVCARCHARRGRFADDDHAGRPFLDAHEPALLEPRLYHADGQVRDEVYVWGSFLQSRMAAAGVTCSDCHDPHRLALRAEGNALCAGCHRPAVYDVPAHHHHEPGTEAARCASCHMPATTFMGVDVRREHAFRVPRPDRSEALGAPDVCTDCHEGREPAWAARAVETWFGPERPRSWRYPETLAAARRLDADAPAGLLALLGDRDEPALARATAARALGSFLDPGSLRGLERALRDADAEVRWAAAGALEALPPKLRLPRLRPLLSDPVRAVRMAAARGLADVPDDRWDPRDREKLDAALEEVRSAARRNADRPEAHLELSLLHLRRGEAEAARREAERARAIDPALVPAAVNLADALRVLGRDDEGEGVLREALAGAPGDPDLHHALGLLLHRTGRAPEALAALRDAAERAPDHRHDYVLGLALLDAGRDAEGLSVLEEAATHRPADRALLAALATLHRDRGARDTAIRWARRLVETAPADPGAAELLRGLEGEAGDGR